MGWKSFINRENIPISAHILSLLALISGISVLIFATRRIGNVMAIVYGVLFLLIIPFIYRESIYRKKYRRPPTHERLITGIIAITLGIILGAITGFSNWIVGGGILSIYGLVLVLFDYAERKDAEEE